jgi:cation transport ATPase
MLSGGAALQQLATCCASSVLDPLAKRIARVAHRKRGTEIEDINLEQAKIGDTIIILHSSSRNSSSRTLPGGRVTEGRAVMDESYSTGESYFGK